MRKVAALLRRQRLCCFAVLSMPRQPRGPALWAFRAVAKNYSPVNRGLQDGWARPAQSDVHACVSHVEMLVRALLGSAPAGDETRWNCAEAAS